MLSRPQPTPTLTGVQPPKAARLLPTCQAATWKEDVDREVLTLSGDPSIDLDGVVEVSW